MIKRQLFYILILLNIIVYSQTQFPEKLSIKNYSTANGLSQNAVRDIKQDNSGILWIATDYGLNKYDGRKFKIYQPSQDDPLSIPSIYITKIVVDSLNNIWLATGEGIVYLDRKREAFSLFQPDSNYRKDYNLNYVFSLEYDDSENVLWAAHPGFGLYKFDIDSKKYSIHEFLPDSLKNNNSLHMWVPYIDKQNMLWVGTGAGAFLLNQDRQFKEFYSPDRNLENHITFREITAFWDEGSIMWIATTNGLNKLDRISGQIEHFLYYKKKEDIVWISDLYLDNNRIMWMPTRRNGLALFNIDTEESKFFKYDNNLINGLSEDRMYCIEADHTDILWLGTRTTGINKIETFKKEFKAYQVNHNSKNSLSTNNIFTVHKTENEIWFGTNGEGVNTLDLKTGKYSLYKYDSKDNSSVNDDYIADIESDIFGNVWIATSSWGMGKKNPNGYGFTRYEYDSTNVNSLPTNHLYSFETDEKGNLWCATSNGLSKFNVQKEIFTNYFSNEDVNSLPSNEVICLEINGDDLWIGTDEGLCLYNVRRDVFTRYFHPSVSEQIVSKIYNLYYDSENLLWMGTEYGAHVFDTVNGTLKHLTTVDGLSDNLVVSIVEDHNNNMWLATNNGLTFYERSTEEFKIFKLQDGLPDNEFNPGVSVGNDGTIYFSGIGGVTYFNPDDITMDDFEPKVIISEVMIHTEEDLSSHGLKGRHEGKNYIFTEPDSLFLDFDQATITMEFVSLHFATPELNLYEYKMDGMDDDWIHMGNMNRVSYNQLAPGEYIFKVRGSNSHAVWATEPTTLFIKIFPPIWDTALFKISGLIFIIILVFFTHKMRTRSLKKRANHLENEVAARTIELREINATKDKFFSIISHDLKNPFSSLIGSSDLLLQKGDNLSEEDRGILIRDIATSSKSTYELLDNLLQWSKTQQGLMELVPVEFDIKEHVESVVRLHSHIANKKGIELQSFIPENLIVSADKNILTSVISNLLTNAIKFSFKGNPVTIRITENNKDVVFSIIDKGVGLSKGEVTDLFKIDKMKTKPGTNREKGSGLGLILCKEFIEKSGGQIWAKSIKGEGSTFEFSLPK